MDTKNTEAKNNLDLIWGAEGIGIVIGRSTRQAFHMLENGMIEGAKKVGGRWVIARGKLREFFLEGEGG